MSPSCGGPSSQGRRLTGKQDAPAPSPALSQAPSPAWAPAPGDEPVEPGGSGRSSSRHPHRVRESAPAALDVRLLLPALAAWASAAWAIGLPGERAWSRVLMAALVLIVLALPLGICTHRFRPPRHRYDPRPGAGALKGPAVGSVCAGLLLSTAAAVAVLTVAAAESAIGLAIMVLVFRNRNSINISDLDSLKG